MAILAIGVLTAVITTKDSHWWTLHFSQLGTIGDFSARTFNSTVIVAGFLLAIYGVVIGMTLPAATGRHTRRGLRGSLISAGLAMTVVGLIPIPVSPVMHDLAASALGLSFLSLVAWSLGLPGLPRLFRRFTTCFVVILATGIVALTAGFITLAFFEATAFSVVGCWLISLPHALRAPTASASALSPTLPTVSVAGDEHEVERFASTPSHAVPRTAACLTASAAALAPRSPLTVGVSRGSVTTGGTAMRHGVASAHAIARGRRTRRLTLQLHGARRPTQLR